MSANKFVLQHIMVSMKQVHVSCVKSHAKLVLEARLIALAVILTNLNSSFSKINVMSNAQQKFRYLTEVNA